MRPVKLRRDRLIIDLIRHVREQRPLRAQVVRRLAGLVDRHVRRVRIRTQGHDLLVDGDAPGPENVDRVVGQLSSLLRDGFKLSHADVRTAYLGDEELPE